MPFLVSNMEIHILVQWLLKVTGILMIICSYTSKNVCLANQMYFSVNPNCSVDCDKPWLIYGKKPGLNTTTHYLWSAVELPSFVMALSVPDAEIKINWPELQAGNPGAVYFSKVPENTFGISFQTLILFNDKNDTGKIDNIPEEYKKYAPLSEFEWNVSSFVNRTDQTKFTFSSTIFRGKNMSHNSKISFSVTAYDEDGRADSLPHLLTTPFSSQIEIVLDHLWLDFNTSDTQRYTSSEDDDAIPISGFDKPRWALDIIVVSDDRPVDDEGRGFLFENDKSLDDEFTPGVFDLSSITTDGARKSSASELSGGYLQWRPVCYLTSDKDINFSTYPNLNTSLPSIDKEHIKNANRSLFYVLFGNNVNNLVGFQTPISFGLSKDEFYTKHNYTEWTFSMGLGAVPDESFSNLIIIVISVAIGIPACLFIFGGAYMLMRSFTRNRGQILITEE